MHLLADLLDTLPEGLQRQVFTHASWTRRRSESYERLAFVGDSVLALAVTTYLYPRLDADRFGAGRLTKIRAQAVSRRTCALVADRLDLARHLEGEAPDSAPPALSRTDSVLAEVLEAVIGAAFLHHGFERTAEAVIDAFGPEIEDAMVREVDFKSTLQERLARRGDVARYDVVAELGPPHERTFEVTVSVEGRPVGHGTGASKKEAEQAAAHAALDELERSPSACT